MIFSVVIPTYNEAAMIEGSLATLVRHLDASRVEFELLIADNGSFDETVKIARDFAARDSRIQVIALRSRGPGRAFVEAVRAAKGDWIVTQDADLSSELTFLDYVLKLSPLVDAVIGSKTFGQQRRKLHRVLASQLYVTFAQLLLDIPQSDFSMGCKAFKRELIFPYLDSLDPWTGFIIELSYLLSRDRRKIVQVGIDCNDTRQSRFNLLHEGIFRLGHLWRLRRQLR